MKRRVFVLIILMMFTQLLGCSSDAKESEVVPLQIGKEAIVEQTKADESKKIVLSLDEVVEVKGVSLKNDIYLAPQVTQFARLKLDHIRKECFDKIKKRYPKANVHISTDKKIFMELEKLEQQLKNKEISEQKLQHKLKKLEEDMKG